MALVSFLQAHFFLLRCLSLQDLLFVHILILSIMNIIPQKRKKKIHLNVASLCRFLTALWSILAALLE